MRAPICIGPKSQFLFRELQHDNFAQLVPSQRASITPIRFSFESGVKVVISRNSGFVSPGRVAKT